MWLLCAVPPHVRRSQRRLHLARAEIHLVTKCRGGAAALSRRSERGGRDVGEYAKPSVD